MAAELRWILLALSLPLLAGIWWWTARKSSHARGDSVLREPTLPRTPDLKTEIKAAGLGAAGAKAAEPRVSEVRSYVEPAADPQRMLDDPSAPALGDLDHPDLHLGEPATPDLAPRPAPTGMRIAPLEPLKVREADLESMHADFGDVPVLDTPMMVSPEATPPPARATAAAMPSIPEAVAQAYQAPVPAVPVAASAAAAPARPAAQPSPAPAAPAPAAPAPPAQTRTDTQRIVTLRVCAAGEARWSGAQLLSALELNGLVYGKYQIFHRKDADGRTLYCVASLIEPGTFDLSMMDSQEFRGVTLFAVLPGPADANDTLDDLLSTARGLAQELAGMVQDGKGVPMSPQRSAALREDIARLQGAQARAGGL